MCQNLLVRRRWPQFGLGTMPLLIAVFALLLARDVNWMRKREAFLANQQQLVRARDVPLAIEDLRLPAPGWLGFFDRRPVWMMPVICDGASEQTLTPSDYERLRQAKQLFPDAKSIVAVHHQVLGQGESKTSLSEPRLD